MTDERAIGGDVPGGLPEFLRHHGFTSPTELSRATGTEDGKPRLLVQGADRYLKALPEAYNSWPRDNKTLRGISDACGQSDDVAVILAYARSLPGLRVPVDAVQQAAGSLLLSRLRRVAPALDRHPQVVIDLVRFAESLAEALDRQRSPDGESADGVVPGR